MAYVEPNSTAILEVSGRVQTRALVFGPKFLECFRDLTSQQRAALRGLQAEIQAGLCPRGVWISDDHTSLVVEARLDACGAGRFRVQVGYLSVFARSLGGASDPWRVVELYSLLDTFPYGGGDGPSSGQPQSLPRPPEPAGQESHSRTVSAQMLTRVAAAMVPIVLGAVIASVFWTATVIGPSSNGVFNFLATQSKVVIDDVDVVESQQPFLQKITRHCMLYDRHVVVRVSRLSGRSGENFAQEVCEIVRSRSLGEASIGVSRSSGAIGYVAKRPVRATSAVAVFGDFVVSPLDEDSRGRSRVLIYDSTGEVGGSLIVERPLVPPLH